jgi:hypothetical protein
MPWNLQMASLPGVIPGISTAIDMSFQDLSTITYNDARTRRNGLFRRRAGSCHGMSLHLQSLQQKHTPMTQA